MMLWKSRKLLRWQRLITKIWKVVIAGVLAVSLILGLAWPSPAHWADVAVADIQIERQNVNFYLTIPTGLVAQFDDDENQQLSVLEITKHQVPLQQFLTDKIRLTANGTNSQAITIQPGNSPKSSPPPSAVQETHSNLWLQYSWANPIEQLQLRYDLFLPGITTARCLVQVRQGDRINNLVLTPSDNRAALIDLPIGQQIGSFITLGIEHILTGYDHILFLISLLLLGGNLRYLLKIVTAFTVAHSVTLTLAVLNIVNLPSRGVEIVIALSIAYIAAENLWLKAPRGRWQLAFAFGLIHGFGFSSILRELDLPSTNLVVSLASFNVGVELGQIAIVLAVYAGLSLIQKLSWYAAVRRLISLGIMGMSLIWLWERVFQG
jgi:hydrogenase/urease accessory protein HupE